MSSLITPSPRREEAISYVLRGLQFGLMSPQDIRKIGMIEIREPAAYDEAGMPVQGGVLDPRLGTINPRQRCPTCGNYPQHCPGHFGRIELAKPVINIGYSRLLKYILNMTCPQCGKVLLPDAERKELIRRARKFWEEHPNKKIDDEIFKEAQKRVNKYLSKSNKCPHCEARVELVDLKEFYKFIVKEPEPRRLWPNEIRDRLERIPDEDAMILGFNPERARPEWIVITVVLVPPPTVRPSIFLETGERSEDDLTHLLVDIIKANQKLSESIASGAPDSVIEGEWELLQYSVAVFFHNAATGLPVATQRGSNRPLKALFQRLSGKEGRLRKNLIGKRVDFSSRTVISPDPMIGVDEVGVPVEIAKVLTIPEYVNEWNIEQLKELVMRGPNEYPGANYLRKRGETRPISLKVLKRDVLEREAEALEPGDVVERHLLDGDYVLFNRQPSLHKLSMMSHKVRVLPGSTFRVNPGTCVPYNADFDGDEMNLHALQLMEARIEAEELMSVKKNLLSPRTGGSIIGAKQDLISAAYILTKKGSVYTREETCDILAKAGITELPEPAIKKPVELWTGKQIFSALLPKGLMYEGRAAVCEGCANCLKEACPYDAYVIIKDGELLRGVIDDDIIGTLVKAKLTLIDVIIRDYGEDEAVNFLNRTIRMLAKIAELQGITMSLNELRMPDEFHKKLSEVFETAYKDTLERVKEFEARRARVRMPRTKEEIIRALMEERLLDFKITKTLDKLRSEVHDLVKKYADPDSDPIIMAKTGARGSLSNLAQVVGSVWQQSVKSKIGFVLTSGRPRKGFKDRVLSYFKPGDLTLEARGFVRHGYYVGLRPTEFIFHSMASRDSLIDKGRRTQDSGYFYRRIANALKDLYVAYDGTVRDSEGRIFQFLFGGDGLDPLKMFRGHIVDYDSIISKFVEPKRGASLKKLKKLVEKEGLPTELAEKLYKAKATLAEAEKVVEEVKKGIERARIEPLTPIGIICAQSIAEPTTQMVLRTFHAPGVLAMDVTRGVERFKEIVFYARTSTPIMKIYLKPDWSKDEEKVKEAIRRIKETTVKDLITEYRIDNRAFELILRPNKERLEKAGLDLEKLISLIEKKVKRIKGTVEQRGEFIVVNMRELAKPGEEYNYQALRKWAMMVVSERIGGIKGIKQAVAELVRTEKGEEFVITTQGSNLKEVLKLEFVDPTRTTTNDCSEIAEVFGIEAARQSLLNELWEVLKEQGLEVDRRYISLIADAMTRNGNLEAVRLSAMHIPSGYFSVAKSPLSQMAFEWTRHVALIAARKGEDNPINSPLDAIITGQIPPVGTGMVSVRWDWKKAKELLAEVRGSA